MASADGARQWQEACDDIIPLEGEALEWWARGSAHKGAGLVGLMWGVSVPRSRGTRVGKVKCGGREGGQ